MNLCAKCIGNKTFSEWIEEKGARGSCEYDLSHGEEYPVVSINLFCDHLDKWFQNQYCLGTDYSFIDSEDLIIADQLGDDLESILSGNLDVSQEVLEDIIKNLPEPNDPYDGEGAFYNDYSNYELIEDVKRRSQQEFDEAFYDYELASAIENKDPFVILQKNCDDIIHLLNETNYTRTDRIRVHYIMLFVYSINSLEAYLYHTFVQKVFSNDTYKDKYIEKCPNLSKEKFFLYEIKRIILKIDQKIKNEISSISFHNLGKIMPLYRDILDIDIGDISNLSKSINKRHDFVHRGGIDTDGNEVQIEKQEILDLAHAIKSFCTEINTKILNLPHVHHPGTI